jgi:hypothetical protein
VTEKRIVKRFIATLTSTIGVVAASCNTKSPEETPAPPFRRSPTLDGPILPPPPSYHPRLDKMRRHKSAGSFMWDKDYPGN